jgi:ornithine cyclodeaminase/alanine dehydrogenase-like protein (mu-crystallin family)
MLVLSREDVEELLDVERLVDALADAMADLSAGRASMPLRIAAKVEDADGLLGAMPVFLPSAGVLETKLVSLFPRNAGTDLPTHQAVIVAFDPDTGHPKALLDATSITEIRTAAGSALATRLLAREEARVLAVLGTGVQAAAHARVVSAVRPFRQIVVAGRDRSRADRFAATVDGDVSVAGSFRDAVEGADVVCACTHSPEPVVRRTWLGPGTHVNSVGFNPDGREVDAETVRDALVVVESRASVLAQPPAGSNDLLWAIRDGVVGQDHIYAEIGELVAGTRPGRTDDEQLTLYKSVGVAVQDAAAVALVLAAAAEHGAGLHIAL